MKNNWYQQARELIESEYGDDWELFADLLAATSPRKQVKANWRLAVRIFDSHIAGEVDYSGTLPCHRPNINRALNGEELSGRKVRAFAANLRGDLDVCTIDVWMGRYFGYETITKAAYDAIEETVKMMAKREGCKPAEMQAEIWCRAIQAEGRTPKSFLAAIDHQYKLFEEVTNA